MSFLAKKSFLIPTVAFLGCTIVGFIFFKIATRPDSSILTARHTTTAPFADSITVAPGTPLFFTWGVTPSPRAKAIARGATGEAERYGDTYAQTRALMTQLTDDLREVGLSLRDVVAVRANLVADPDLDMAGWDRAFGEFFGNAANPHRPARTTIGISRLFIRDYLAEVEFVAAVPAGRGPFTAGSRFERLHGRLNRAETNPNVKTYGRPAWPLATGKAIAPATALYFQSAMFPEPMMPRMLTMSLNMRMFRGDMSTQAESIFNQSMAALRDAGLTAANSIFTRNILYPDPKQNGFLDFSSFNAVYHQHYNNADNPNRVARTIMSSPGYARQGQLMTMETYAAYAGDQTARFTAADGSPVPLVAYGLSAERDHASGVATSGTAALTFVSGLIAPARGTMTEEAEAVFALARERLAAYGTTFDHVAQLRAYLNVGTRAPSIAEFQRVYAAAFPGPHKPALTILPVAALASDAQVEVEIITAHLPSP